jgi:hypothetical protein
MSKARDKHVFAGLLPIADFDLALVASRPLSTFNAAAIAAF